MVENKKEININEFNKDITIDKLVGGENVANPILAVIISFFLPGIGSVYAGKVMMGIVLFIIAIILAVLYSMVFYWLIILYIIVWLYGMYDAYTTAKATET